MSVCPYHYENGEEEWIVVLTGSPTLRTPDGEQQLHPWDCVFCPTGEAGAHKVTNNGDEPARIIIWSNRANPATTIYPDSNKVLGGYDFVGDAYDAGDPNHTTPAPDPNPLDCDGHGTHVAGIAAGYGENPNGTTFAGDYTTLPTDPTNSYAAYRSLFRIGPGMAPKAKLYAYKVFGCTGSTDLITAAIDRAADPNGDGNPSDHTWGACTSCAEYESDGVFGAIGYTAVTPAMCCRAGSFATFV